MASFNLEKEMENVDARLRSREQTLGKGLLQPNRGTNSGSRAILQCTQIEQVLPLMNPEPPIYGTGYENKYGEMSSSYIVADANYTVIDKIPKFSFDSSKNRKYAMILLDSEHDVLHHIERTSFEYISESYGHRYRTNFLDDTIIGDVIPEGTVLKTSTSFNEYLNRQDGVNLSTMYCAYGPTTEDPVVLSKSAAAKLASPLFDKIRIMVNDNDILLNLYGSDQLDQYKTFPNIGEDIKNGILCAIRREKKEEEALFSQSWKQLKEIMISDEKYPVSRGTVVDIDVFCNNPDSLRNSIYNQQVLTYYNETKVYCQKVVDCVRPLVERGLRMTYDLSKFYSYCLDVINDAQYINDKVFNGIILDISIMKYTPIAIGDKITDRYGGKGVISQILEDEDMPYYMDASGEYVPVEIIYNKCTCVNRLNPGQLFEISVNAYSEAIVNYIYDKHYIDAANIIYKFLRIVVPNMAEDFMNTFNAMPYDDQEFYIKTITYDGIIFLIAKPLTEMINIDTLTKLKEEFPFINIQRPVMIKMEDSSGNIRRIPSNNRNVTIGKKYIYRLKQIADDKFSTVSLAATNIRGENTKSKASKLHKSLFSSTPVRFGEMEFTDLLHMLDALLVDCQLMRLSSSPIGRAQHEDLLTGDPFCADIKLNSEAKSRPVEIVNAYLKTIGLRLEIKKKKRNVDAVMRTIYKRLPRAPIYSPYQRKHFDIPTEQAIDLVTKYKEYTGQPMEVVWRTDEASTVERMQRYMYEAAELANRAIQEYGISTLEELESLINAKKIQQPMIDVVRIYPYKRIPKTSIKS